MDQQSKQKIIYRLIAGFCRLKVNSKLYYIVSPTADILYEAAEFYDEVYQDNLYKEWLSLDEAKQMAIKNGIWSEDGDEKIETCDKTIEEKKVEIYQTYLTNPTASKEARIILKKVREFQNSLLIKKHAYDHLTLEGYSEFQSQCFMFSKIILNSEKKPLWDSYYSSDQSLLNTIINEYKKHGLSGTQIRELAKTEPWRTLWSIHKEHNFTNTILNDDQRTLVLYSRMYDSIYNHPECPADDMVLDDDVIDGWLIVNRKNADKERKAKQATSLIGGNIKENAGEVFVVVPQFDSKGNRISKTEQDKHAKQIYDLNDMTGRATIHQREKFLSTKGDEVIKVTELPDVQVELTHLSKEKFKSKFKGK